jgi:pectinesterase
VAKDGSGNYKTIQEAINATRDLGKVTVKIFIKKGVYHEKVIVPSWKTNISLIGESRDSTIITYEDFSGKPNPGGTDAFGKDKFTTYTSYTVLVQGNDFSAENLTIQNTAWRVGQAVALHVEGDRAVIKNCKILGNQDTLYATKENSRQYYDNCYIEGTTDFIFGEAIAVFQNCTIKSLVNSYITAAATRHAQLFGYVFFDCKLIADTAAKKVYLGRPWRSYAKTVFIRCEIGSHIVPEGWDPWKGDAMFPDKEKTTFYAEYKNTGAGATVTGRVPWSKQLTDDEVRSYTIKNILGGNDNWNPLMQ